ncbi:zinc ribbon domain-containing protein [Noviherbaspirillum galbum]|uniref:Transposase n=1 Tax=Noviherbaspirillum galbum TaxID=2709383 RepID=A0A6B3SRN7_9BURK|nr:zinc ribbon domain-containing protein [Noviherbaspirillum galbum]NEX63437.1 transposase [Noviherbaspirillum galbum]
MAQHQITFVYGLLAPDTPELVDAHLNERNALWNRLINRHQATQTAFEAHLKQEFPHVASGQAQLAQERMALAIAVKDKVPDLQERKQRIKEQYDSLRALIDATPAIAALSQQHSQTLFELANQDIKASFLWWPNHETLMREFIQARARSLSKRMPLGYRAVAGEGSLYVTFKRPVPVLHLFGKCPTVAIVGEGRRRELKLTVATNGRCRADKQFATFPLIYHRPLPEGALVRQVRLVCRRVGSQRKYEAQFVLSGATRVEPPPGKKVAAGMDLGWRVTESGMRVATIVDEAGEGRHVELPADWMLRSDYVEDIDTQLSASLVPHIETFKSLALTRETAWLAPMLSRERPHAASLALKVLQAGQRPVPPAIAQWVASVRSLVEEQAHLREKLLAQRLDIYRKVVADCCRKYHTLSMEKLNLKSLQLVHGGDAWIDHQRRTHRHRAALSILIRLFKEAAHAKRIALAEHPAAYTTCTCHACGHINESKPTLEIKCAGCGVTWDQDENSATNFLIKIRPRHAA